jgi:hypothetical protein
MMRKMDNNESFTPQDTLIQGDKDAGICIGSWENMEHSFQLEGSEVNIRQEYSKISDNARPLSFSFNVSAPIRFSLEILLPQEAANACAVLNKQVLIMPFAENWPQETVPLNLTDCQKKGSAVSTFSPGEFQKINFRWQQGDQLIIYLILH